MTRRRFLQLAGLATASGVGAAGAAGVSHAAERRVRLAHYRVPWRGNGRLRVVHMTDLHVGWGTPARLLEQSVALCHGARPDLVVLTGDYINRSLAHLPRLRELVRRLPRPCVATLGNHDHWSGARAIEAAFAQLGVPVLRNAHLRLTIGAVQIPVVGIDDGFTRHDDVTRAFAGLADPAAALVLTHYPSTAAEIVRCGAEIIFAGHTHGGQIGIPLVTRAVARWAGSPYLAGWYRLGTARLFVNVGIGSSAIRFRVGAQASPEVACIDLG